jgi:MerR family transcriptional regulator, light-induced transcriptional regulator
MMADFATRLRALRKERGMRQKDLAEALGIAQTTVANYENGQRFPDEETLWRTADLFDSSLDYLLGRTEKNVSPRSAALHAPAVAGAAAEYLRLVRARDKQAAFQFLQESLAGAKGIKDLYEAVLTPALHEVGRLWEAGEMTVGEEHFISEATQAFMSRLSPPVGQGVSRRGARAFAFAAGGEPHTIAVHMVADVLEADGWDASFLGGNLPVEHAMAALREGAPNLLALSVTSSHNVGFARELIASVGSDPILGRVKIIVGGRAFLADPELWRRIGAHAMARGLDDAAEVAAALLR